MKISARARETTKRLGKFLLKEKQVRDNAKNLETTFQNPK